MRGGKLIGLPQINRIVLYCTFLPPFIRLQNEKDFILTLSTSGNEQTTGARHP
jgi:hypothetical protein